MMSPTLRALIELLSCEPTHGGTNSDVLIKEEDKSASLKTIKLSGLTKDMLVFFPDKGGWVIVSGKKKHIGMSPLFRCDKSVKCNKACDAVVIVADMDDKFKIIYVELKSTDPSGAGQQFRSTKCFIDYLRATLKEFHNITFGISISRYVVLCGKQMPLSKRPTQYKRKPANDPTIPEIRTVVNNQIIQIRELV